MAFMGLIFLLLWYEVKLCCIYKVFRLAQGRLLWVEHCKSQYELLPLVLCVISLLKCIIHKNFDQINLWMLISFIILFMIDVYKDNHVHP